MEIPIQQLIRIGGIVGGAMVSIWLLSFVNARMLHWVIKGGTPEKDRRMKTLKNVFLRTGVALICLFALIMMLKELALDPSPLLASAGLAGLAITFGAQSLIKDVFFGFIILAENQYSEGDYVKLDDTQGIVEKLTLRKSVIRDKQQCLHHVPHGQVRIVTVIAEADDSARNHA